MSQESCLNALRIPVQRKNIPSADSPLHTWKLFFSTLTNEHRFHTFSILQIDKSKPKQIHFFTIYSDFSPAEERIIIPTLPYPLFFRSVVSVVPFRPCPRLRMENPSSFGSEVQKTGGSIFRSRSSSHSPNKT